MGYVSCQEDNLDAKGESLRSPSRQQTKETKAVKEEMPKDGFGGKPFTQDVAEKTLMQCAERGRSSKKQWLTITEWAEYLRDYHEKKEVNFQKRIWKISLRKR